MKRSRHALLASAAALLFATDVGAQDFTITVPVEITQLSSDIERITVICAVTHLPPSNHALVDYYHAIEGNGSYDSYQAFAVTNSVAVGMVHVSPDGAGAYSDVEILEMNTEGLSESFKSLMRYWQCGFLLTDGTNSAVQYPHGVDWARQEEPSFYAVPSSLAGDENGVVWGEIGS